MITSTPTQRGTLFEFLLRLGDERLILGHRLSEWCGHAPVLEEDLALANIALDLLGQGEALLALAGETEGKGRSADKLAYFRDAIEFRNPLLVELPIGDFGFTIARQFLFDVYGQLLYRALGHSAFEPLASLAHKALREIDYHRRHSQEWVLRLGGGTEESHRRIQTGLEEVWRFTGELFTLDPLEQSLVEAGVAADRRQLFTAWESEVQAVLARADLEPPSDVHPVTGGFQGRHTEHLGHLLAEMQILARSHPGAEW